MDEARFARLLDRMHRSGVAGPQDLAGCTPFEIAAVEDRYAVRLPQTYRRYLEVMGHTSGRLFRCDHAAVSYPHLLAMTADLRTGWAESEVGTTPGFELPADALVILGRLSEQFEFIRCSDPDDSPVWYFNTWDWTTRQTEPSVLAWLESWRSEAEAAIAGGYFDLFPDGTTP